MVLQKQLISIPLGSQSMNSDVDAKLNPGVTRSIDTIYNREGAVSKRYGSEKVVATAFDDKYVASYQNNPIIVGDAVSTTPAGFDGTRYSREYGNAAKLFHIDAYGVGHSQKDAWHYCDIAETGNIVAVSYTTLDKDSDEYSVYVETFDKITGIRLDSEEIETGLTRIGFCKLAQVGDIRLSYHYIDSSGTAKGNIIDPDDGSITAVASIDGAPACKQDNPQFDLSVVWKDASHPYVMMIYPHTDGYGFQLVSMAAGSPSASYTNQEWFTESGSSALRQVGIFPQKDYNDDGYATILAEIVVPVFYFSYIYAATYDYTCTKKVSEDTVDVNDFSDGYSISFAGVAVSDDLARIYVCWDDVSDLHIPKIKKTHFYNNNGTGVGWAHSQIFTRARLATKIAREGNTSHHYYGVFTKSWGYAYEAQGKLLWIDKDQNVVGKSLLGTARLDDAGDAYNIMPQVQRTDDDGYEWTTCMSNLIYDDNSKDNKDLYQIRRLRLKSNITNYPNVIETPIGCFIANSCPYELDESRVHEAGFLQYPEPFSLAAAAGAGLSEGIYHYYLVYEWTDSKGIKHRSRTSPEIGQVTTTSGNCQVTITCPTLTFTRKENVQIAIYRTKVGPTTRFYRVGTVANTTSSPTTTYTDTSSDDDIEDNEAIYTTGNVLPNAQPFSCEIAALHQNRLFYVDNEHKKTRIYYTKEYNSVDSAGYSDILLISCDPAGGNITALAGLLDKLIIFKGDRIYATEGEGLDSTGAGSNFTIPYLISPNVGCINKHSIIQVPNGLMFLAGDGIWLLDNSLQLSPVGDPVTHYTDSLSIKGVGKDNENNLVKWYTDGYGIVYNWDRNRWSLWTGRECESAVYTAGNTFWVDSSGYLWTEDTDSWADNTAEINSRTDTGWFSFANVGGYQRVYRIFLIGQKRADHKLRVRIGYDYDGYYSDVQTFDSSDIESFEHSTYFANGVSTYEGEHYVLQIFPRNPRCSSIRISMEEYDSTGAGWELSSVAFLVGVESESVRVKNGKTFHGV